MKTIYVAHQLGKGADLELNRLNAAKWACWIAETYGVAVSCTWIVLASIWQETEHHRAIGMRINLDQISRCDEVYLVGGRISEGMQLEANEAWRLGKPVLSFIEHGFSPPSVVGWPLPHKSWTPGSPR